MKAVACDAPARINLEIFHLTLFLASMQSRTTGKCDILFVVAAPPHPLPPASPHFALTKRTKPLRTQRLPATVPPSLHRSRRGAGPEATAIASCPLISPNFAAPPPPASPGAPPQKVLLAVLHAPLTLQTGRSSPAPPATESQPPSIRAWRLLLRTS